MDLLALFIVKKRRWQLQRKSVVNSLLNEDEGSSEKKNWPFSTDQAVEYETARVRNDRIILLQLLQITIVTESILHLLSNNI